MIIETSALMAILLGEPEQEAFTLALRKAGDCRLSAGSWIELAAVITRRLPAWGGELDRLMQRFDIAIAPVSVVQARIGHEAYRRYGIGAGHPARLNFGDCFAYALAKESDEPLLFKGDDFARTDVTPALAP